MNNNMTSSSDSLENLENYENQSESAEFEILAKNISDSSEKSDEDWTQEWVLISRCYILPSLAVFGIFFNLVSAGVLVTKKLHLKRSLAKLFAFLNISDSVYLFCMLLVFSLPKLSDSFKLSIVYTLPLLQTSLTISVYATVTIAICGWLYIRPVAQSTEQSTTTITNNIEKSNSSVTPAVRVQNAVVQNRFKCCIRYNGSKTIWLSMGLVTIFGFLFNISRWFEIRVVPKKVPITENDTTNSSSNVSNVKFNLRFTELRNNPLYVRYYSLIGSGFVMVVLPMFILISTFITLMRYIPKGSTKNKTMRIMAIIIIMFVTCHLPKLFLTGYELFSSNHSPIANEFNNILLVSYSAFNPFAYCGELIFQVVFQGYFKCVYNTRRSTDNQNNLQQHNQHAQNQTTQESTRIRQINRRRKRLRMPKIQWIKTRQNLADVSEFDMMKSVGITLGGPDPIPQQLYELDEQSRLMCGLGRNSSSNGGNSEDAVAVSASIIQAECRPQILVH